MVLLAVGAICAAHQSARPLTLMLAGDIMLNGIGTKQKPLAKIAPLLSPASCAVANLEIPLTTAKNPTPRKSAADLQARNQFILKADPGHASGIAAAGIDIVSLGNNHCMDYCDAGLSQMTRSLKKWGIRYAGAGSTRQAALEPAVYTTAGGQRVALISALAFVGAGALGHCTPAGNAAGVATLNFGGSIDKDARARLRELVGEARRAADVVIVGLHWGIERQTLPTAYQVALGRACVDAGADVVWGNHPHVLQGGEWYKGKPILYSMGNLISSKPGATGLVKLVFSPGRRADALFLPLVISGGSVSPINGRAGQVAAKQYEALCDRLEKAYPSKDSRPLVGPKAVQNKAQ